MVEPLQPVFDVDHGAAFFGPRAGWKNDRSERRGLVCGDPDDHEEFKTFEPGFGNPTIDRILAEDEEPGDLPALHRFNNFRKPAGGHAEKFGTRSVRISVVGNEESVAFLRTRENVDILNAECRGEFSHQKEFFVRHPRGSNNCGFLWLAGLQFFRRDRQRVLPFRGGLRPTHRGFFQAAVALEVVKIQAVAVGHPARVDVIVFARGDPLDDIFAAGDEDV